MRAFAWILVLLFSFDAHAKRILIDDDAVAEIRGPRAASKTASNGNEMRTKRRVGLGMMAAGPLGLGGVTLELNFNDRSGILGGYGGGMPGFQSWTVQYKRVLAGEWLLPYMAFGFSRWSNFDPKPGIRETTPGLLEERFLSQGDREQGIINEYLIYPAMGLQYVQLEGPWAGFNIYAELDVLLDVVDFAAAPTGAFGVGYFF